MSAARALTSSAKQRCLKSGDRPLFLLRTNELSFRRPGRCGGVSMADYDTPPDTRRLEESTWQSTAESGDSNVKRGDKRSVSAVSGDKAKQQADGQTRKK